MEIRLLRLVRATLVAILGAFLVTGSVLAEDKPSIVFVIGEGEYETAETLPRFATAHLRPLGFPVRFVHADAADGNHFPDLADALEEADLLILSVRRRTPPAEELAAIRNYLAQGKPLLAIRTSSHAFSLREGEPPAGHAEWPDFDRQVLGGRYDNHLNNRQGTVVSSLPRAVQHPILTGIGSTVFRSGGTLYRSFDLSSGTQVLLKGSTISAGQPVEMPVAWTHRFGDARVFYTSLGHRSEFANPVFNRLLTNAVHWCVGLDPPESATADRDRYKPDLAANERVAEMIRSFEGRGEVGDGSQPTSPEEAVELFQVVDDLTIELVAAEPRVMQPLYISWDERGRMWVVQYLQYPFPAGLKVVSYDQHLRAVFDKVPPPPPNHFRGRDKITVFEDTTGDGRYDSAKDVITGLNIATSVVTGRGGIWVLNPPYLLFYPDHDRDDVPDSAPEVHLTGFGLEDTHSVANSLCWGPDGWLYGANGSTTTATINSAATRNVHFKGQCIWRYQPETKVFEIYAEGGGNTFSVEIDSGGRVFSGTNGGNTRGMYYPQGSYGEKNWGKHGPLTNPYAFGYFKHMRHEGFRERFSQTFAIYEGGSLPSRYHRTIVSANALHNRVLASELIRDTSTYRTRDLPPVVLSPDRWFRPVDVKVGPDGAVYMADWYDSRLTHVDPRDNWHKTSGRIYRLAATKAQPLQPFDLADLSSDELIKMLGHQNKWFRQTAVRILGERKDSNVLHSLQQITLDPQDGRSLEAFWALHLAGGFSEQLARNVLRHPEADLRRWAVRLLGDRREVSPPTLGALVELAKQEPDAQVRAQLASSAKRFPPPEALPLIRTLVARSEDADDLHIPLLIWWALERVATQDPSMLLAFFTEPQVWELPIVEQNLVARSMQRFAMAGSEQDLETCAALLALAPAQAQREELMAGFMAAYQGRQIVGLPESLQTALADYQRSLGESDLALGLRLGSSEAVRKTLRIISDPNAPRAQRLTLLEILGQIDEAKAVPAMLNLLGRRGEYDIKRVALLALMNYKDARIGKAIVSRLYSTLPDESDVRETAWRVLASRPAWTLELLGELEASRLKAETIPLEVVQQMKLQDHPEVNELIERFWGKVQGGTSEEKKQAMERVAALLRPQQGDLAAGRLLFKESCAKCHTLFGEGGNAGPDLTGYERSNLDFLLLAILDPSAAIREEYTNYLVVTDDGRTLTGLLEDQTSQTVTLRDVNGQAVLVPTADVDELRALPVSLMPDGLLDKMSDEQIRDLFAYLMSRAPSTFQAQAGNASE